MKNTVLAGIIAFSLLAFRAESQPIVGSGWTRTGDAATARTALGLGGAITNNQSTPVNLLGSSNYVADLHVSGISKAGGPDGNEIVSIGVNSAQLKSGSGFRGIKLDGDTGAITFYNSADDSVFGKWDATGLYGLIAEGSVTNPAGSRVAYLSDVGKSTNIFHVSDYGAIGDGTTVDDAAFSNCLAAAVSNGGIMSWEGRGKTYVLSNMVFCAGSDSHRLALRGYGSKIIHAGTNWLMRWTNTPPESTEGIYVTGNANSPGGWLNIGAKSHCTMRDVYFQQYVNGYGFLGEGCTDWVFDRMENTYCRIGQAFGCYTDGVWANINATANIVGVEFGVTNRLFQLNGLSPIPKGGYFKIEGNHCADVAIVLGSGTVFQYFGESNTNSLFSVGHNAQRHSWQAADAANGPLYIMASDGINQSTTNGVIELNTSLSYLKADIVGYGGALRPAAVKSMVVGADTSIVDVHETVSTNAFALSTGQYRRGLGNAGENVFNSLNKIKHDMVSGSYYNGTYMPAFAFGSIAGNSMQDVMRVGWWASTLQYNTNFTGGMMVGRYGGVYKVAVTNANLEVLSPDATAKIILQGSLGVSNVVTIGTGTGTPDLAGNTMLVVNQDTAAAMHVMSGDLGVNMIAGKNINLGSVGTRSRHDFAVRTANTNRLVFKQDGTSQILPGTDAVEFFGSGSARFAGSWIMRGTNQSLSVENNGVRTSVDSNTVTTANFTNTAFLKTFQLNVTDSVRGDLYVNGHVRANADNAFSLGVTERWVNLLLSRAITNSGAAGGASLLLNTSGVVISPGAIEATNGLILPQISTPQALTSSSGNTNWTLQNLGGDVCLISTNVTAAGTLKTNWLTGDRAVGTTLNSHFGSGSAVSFTTATPAGIISLSLTPGTWMVSGNANFVFSSATVTSIAAGIYTSVTILSDGTQCYSGHQYTTTSAIDTITVPTRIVTVTSPTTVYLVGSVVFSAGSVAGFGDITAVRISN